jgi:hypothetical protein
MSRSLLEQNAWKILMNCAQKKIKTFKRTVCCMLFDEILTDYLHCYTAQQRSNFVLKALLNKSYFVDCFVFFFFFNFFQEGQF